MQDNVKDIVDVMIPLNYLPTRLLSSYLRYVRLGQFLSMNGEVLPTVERLMIDDKRCKEQGFRFWSVTCFILLKETS